MAVLSRPLATSAMGFYRFLTTGHQILLRQLSEKVILKVPPESRVLCAAIRFSSTNPPPPPSPLRHQSTATTIEAPSYQKTRKPTTSTNAEVETENFADSAATTAHYPVKNLSVQCCGELYQKWRKKWWLLYRHAPAEGLNVNVEYADSLNWAPPGSAIKERAAEDTPTVLILHGSPGSHHDFSHLIAHLSDKFGARVLAPNFPDYQLTIKSRSIWKHTPDEKATYIKEFLKTLDVKRIDMLIGHSSGAFPSMLLYDDPQLPPVRSVALFSAAGHRRIKAMRPGWFTEPGIRFYLTEPGRWFFNNFGAAVLTFMGFPVNMDNMYRVMLSATAMVYSNYGRMRRQLPALRASGVPLLWLFSEKDKLVEREIFYEMSAMLGLGREHYNYYDDTGKLARLASKSEPNMTTVVFQQGGHYAFKQNEYVGLVSRACEQLLARVIEENKSRDTKA